MSEDDKEMSDEELNSLLSDLESKADQGGGPSAEESMDDEDIESFLADLEADDSEPSSGGSKPSKTADVEQQGPDLSDLGMDDQVPAETAEDADGSDRTSGGEMKKGGAGEQKEASDSSGSPSRNWRWALKGGLWLVYALPVLVFGWLLGAYLGTWVSAGWLILIMSSLVTAGIPFGLYRAAGSRGKFRWWLSAASLLLTLGLTVPMADSAGEALVEHGHWPATAISEISGGGLGGFVSIGETASGWVGGLLAPQAAAAASATALGQGGAADVDGPDATGTEGAGTEGANEPAETEPSEL